VDSPFPKRSFPEELDLENCGSLPAFVCTKAAEERPTRGLHGLAAPGSTARFGALGHHARLGSSLPMVLLAAEQRAGDFGPKPGFFHPAWTSRSTGRATRGDKLHNWWRVIKQACL